jgi:hypothetical protein
MPSQRRRENPLVEIARARVLHARPWPQSQLLRHCWHFRSTQNSLSLPGAPSAQEEFEPVGHPEPGTLLASTKDVDLVPARHTTTAPTTTNSSGRSPAKRCHSRTTIEVGPAPRVLRAHWRLCRC